MVVVGAGMAGLAAARALVSDHGMSAPGQVVVLEARSRVGGRIHTARDLGVPVELGAAWIHTSRGNPVSTLRRRLGLAGFATRYGRIDLHRRDGTPFPRGAWARSYRELWRPVYRRALRDGYARDEDAPFDDVLAPRIADLGLTGDDAELLDWNVFWELELDLSTRTDRLSSWYADAGRLYDGPDVVLPGGYDAIPAGIASGAVDGGPALDVRTGVVVRAVDTSGGRVTVDTDAGVLTADRCICTLPLGVLRAGAVDFPRGLPSGIERAIGRLGFGRGCKVALRFPERFWDADAHFLGSVGDTRGASVDFFHVGRHADGAPVLVLFANQDLGGTLEAAGTPAAAAYATERLRSMFGTSVPDPVASLSTTWGASPFTRGTYSHFAPGSSPADCRAFREPADGVLHFAGEHTHPHFPSTVHGAWLSGRIAAAAAVESLTT